MPTYELPKTLTLDVSTWRCGSLSARRHNRHGTGETRLLNEEGYLCCLGQFCLQAGVERKALLGCSAPGPLAHDQSQYVKVLTMNAYSNSSFSQQAININDNDRTTLDAKIALLTELCQTENRELVVVGRKSAKAAP